MFGRAVDKAFGVGVVVFSLPYKEEDLERYHAMLLEGDALARSDHRPALIMISEDGYPPPSAIWRKRILEAACNFKNMPFFVLVTSSRLVALASTALAWIRPLPYERTTVTTFDDAVRWMEAKRGVKLGRIFQGLLKDARASRS